MAEVAHAVNSTARAPPPAEVRSPSGPGASTCRDDEDSSCGSSGHQQCPSCSDFDPFFTGEEFLDDGITEFCHPAAATSTENILESTLETTTGGAVLVKTCCGDDYEVIGGGHNNNISLKQNSFVSKEKSSDVSFLPESWITAVCGHYFIGGREFHSLPALVSNLAHRLCLSSPVPPPPHEKIVPRVRKVVATLPFCGMADTDELSFSKGDLFFVQQNVGDGWLWATNLKNSENGLVHESFTEEFSSSSIESLPYFVKNWNSEDLDLLLNSGIGSFLVRPSERGIKCLTLMVNTGCRVGKFLISKLEDHRFEIGGRHFQSIHDIVDRYREVEICDGCRLTSPVILHKDENEFAVTVEEICQKLEFKRLSSKTSCPDASKAGNVWKKSEKKIITGATTKSAVSVVVQVTKPVNIVAAKENKKWKCAYLMLKDVEGQLFCFDSEKRAKPKHVLDLCYCFLQPVHDSLFGRPNTFQLVSTSLDPSIYYFCVENGDDYEEWIGLLRPLCSGLTQSSFAFSSSAVRHLFRTDSTLSDGLLKHSYNLVVKIFEAKQLCGKVGSDCYCVVSLNGAKVAKTMAVISSECVIWDEQFILRDVQYSPAQTIEINLFSKSRGGRYRDTSVGKIKFGELKYQQRCDGWFPVTCRSQSSAKCDVVGQVRVMINVQQLPVMPVEEYSCLKEVLLAEKFLSCHWLGQICQEEDRNSLCKSLLDCFLADNLHFKLMISEIDREIKATTDPKTLFRGANFCTALLNQYIRHAAGQYVAQTLRPVVLRIADLKQCFEIESSRTDQSRTIPIRTNALQLVSVTQEVCRAIFTSSKQFPSELRYLFTHLKRKVAEKWPREPLLKLRAIGLLDSVSKQASRNLVLIAKILQALANLADSVSSFQSPELEPVRTFITDTSNHMSSYLNEISSVCPEPEPSNSFVSKNCAKDFAVIFHIASRKLDCLQQKILDDNCVLKKMVSVIQLLNSHQNQYLALARSAVE